MRDDNYYEDDEDEYITLGIFDILGLLAKWFIRIGLFVGLLLIIYYIFTLQFLSLLLFLIILVVSFFFGYFFMFCLDTFLVKE